MLHLFLQDMLVLRVCVVNGTTPSENFLKVSLNYIYCYMKYFANRQKKLISLVIGKIC